jgi:hypothetical protein
MQMTQASLTSDFIQEQQLNPELSNAAQYQNACSTTSLTIATGVHQFDPNLRRGAQAALGNPTTTINVALAGSNMNIDDWRRKEKERRRSTSQPPTQPASAAVSSGSKNSRFYRNRLTPGESDANFAASIQSQQDDEKPLSSSATEGDEQFAARLQAQEEELAGRSSVPASASLSTVAAFPTTPPPTVPTSNMHERMQLRAFAGFPGSAGHNAYTNTLIDVKDPDHSVMLNIARLAQQMKSEDAEVKAKQFLEVKRQKLESNSNKE